MVRRRRAPKGRRKQDILDSARELFSERGFEETSLDAIIAHSGTSKGTLYHYFASKEDLYTTVLESMLERVWAAIDLEQLAHTTSATFWQEIYNWWHKSIALMVGSETDLRLWKDFQENMRFFNDSGPTRRLRERSLFFSEKLLSIGQEVGCVRKDLTSYQCAELIESLDIVMDGWFFKVVQEYGIEYGFQHQMPISLGLIWRILSPATEFTSMPVGIQ